jgi:hypothetical protein
MAFVKWYGIRKKEQYIVNGPEFGKWYCMRPILLQPVHCMPHSAQQTEQVRTGCRQMKSRLRYRRSSGTHILKSLGRGQ